jgi:glycosyltransferase involved in cell wall biosynthesis
MMNTKNPKPFSFLILSFNEELHIGRLLSSVQALAAEIFVLDSGSSDGTLDICKQYSATVKYHPFENHPKQWHVALNTFNINTPWVIALDADQIVTPSLFKLLEDFDEAEYPGVNGIYFNRKNYFKGRWIRHGGYYPFYMLKMFRLSCGISDLNENMDHRFLISGKTRIWKEGYLLEENLKENNIRFWIEKHNRYSDQLATEEIERMQQLRVQVLKPKLVGSLDERKAYFKAIWWKLPRYLRPVLYFGYRIIVQCGFLDGRTGIIFHFLQSFWFRLIVDIKIDELLRDQRMKILSFTAEGPKLKKYSNVSEHNASIGTRPKTG